MQVIVDNTSGGDAQLAADVAAGLRGRDVQVELRQPRPGAAYDTSVHLVMSGLAVRVTEQPDRALMGTIEEVVRASLQRRPSLRRRTRSVPVLLGEGARALAWIDVFDGA